VQSSDVEPVNRPADAAANFGVQLSDVEPVERAADVAVDVGVQSSDVEPVNRRADVAANFGVQSSDVEPVERAADVAARVENVLACSRFYKRQQQSETVRATSQRVRSQRKTGRPLRYDC